MNEIAEKLHSKDSIDFINTFRNDTNNIDKCIVLLRDSEKVSQEIQLFLGRSLLNLIQIIENTIKQDDANELVSNIMSIFLLSDKTFSNATISLIAQSIGTITRRHSSLSMSIFDIIFNEENQVKLNEKTILILVFEILTEYKEDNSYGSYGKRCIKNNQLINNIYIYAKNILQKTLNKTTNRSKSESSDIIHRCSSLFKLLFSLDEKSNKKGEIRVNQISAIEQILSNGNELQFIFNTYDITHSYEMLQGIYYLASSYSNSFGADITIENQYESDMNDGVDAFENLSRKQVFDKFFNFVSTQLMHSSIYQDESTLSLLFSIITNISRNVNRITPQIIHVITQIHEYYKQLQIRNQMNVSVLNFIITLFHNIPYDSLHELKDVVVSMVKSYIERLFQDQHGVDFARGLEKETQVLTSTIEIFHSLVYQIMMEMIFQPEEKIQKYHISMFIYISSIFITIDPQNGTDILIRPEQKILISKVLEIISNIPIAESELIIERSILSFIHNLTSIDHFFFKDKNISTPFQYLSDDEKGLIQKFDHLEDDEKQLILSNRLMQIYGILSDETFFSSINLENVKHRIQKQIKTEVLESLMAFPILTEEIITFLLENDEFYDFNSIPEEELL